MLHKDYARKGSGEKIPGPKPQGVLREGEVIGHKPPVVKNFVFHYELSQWNSHMEAASIHPP
jgi:hypothetical protein